MSTTPATSRPTLFVSAVVIALRASRSLFHLILGRRGKPYTLLFMRQARLDTQDRSQDYGAADNVSGGKIALSADGDTVLWRTSANGVQVSQYTNPFAAVPSLPSDAAIASDKKNNSIFYGASGSKFYLSTDGGKSFSSPATLGSSTSPSKVIVNPGVTGDIWVSTDKGIFHSTDSGSTFAAVSGVAQVRATVHLPLHGYSHVSSTGVGHRPGCASQDRWIPGTFRCCQHRRCRLLQIRRCRCKLGEDKRCCSRFRLCQCQLHCC